MVGLLEEALDRRLLPHERDHDLAVGGRLQHVARAEAEAAIPLRRIGNPAEFGRVAAFVLSPAASYLTGAMIPYAFGSSDGLFNLGSALSFAQVLPPGVYIAMNGQHFEWDTVRKNRETGVFESL